MKVLPWFFSVFWVCVAKPTKMKIAMEHLTKYGYMDKNMLQVDYDLHIDEIKDGIKEYQDFHGLKATGKLTEETMKMMKMPRCGMPDKPKTGERTRRYIVEGLWEKKNLTYRIINYYDGAEKSDVDHEMRRAFSFWTNHAPLDIKKSSAEKVDITIVFEEIDKKGKVLGRAYYPPGGKILFDKDEKWTMNTAKGTNFLQVATHEVGHALGLAHMEKSKKSVMYPTDLGYDAAFGLSQDDINGIQHLYGSYQEN